MPESAGRRGGFKLLRRPSQWLGGLSVAAAISAPGLGPHEGYLSTGGWASALLLSRALSTENDVDPGEHQFELDVRHFTHRIAERAPVKGDGLGDVGHRISGESCQVRGQEHIAGGIGPSHVARERDADNRSDPTAVERITLHYHDGAPLGPQRETRRGDAVSEEATLRSRHGKLLERCTPAQRTGLLCGIEWD